MKVELLVLIPESESFCTSKKSFIEFLKVDSLIGITGQKISYKRSHKSKEISSAKFRVETDLVKSKQERYFTIVLEALDGSNMDEFNELCDRVRSISERISPGKTTINTLWDDVGRAYAEKSYPLINEVENLMRRLIAKFMLITVGVNWSKDTIHPDLFKKIDSFSDDDPHVNDLFKLDFIHLKEVLFGKKRDISTEELDRLLMKTQFSEIDQETIKKYIPKSNWEKYFSTVIEESGSSVNEKWAILYNLRNKVAHNRHVKRSDFEKIKGLCDVLKEIINKASSKLGEIDIDEEDRDLIIYTFNSESSLVAERFLQKAAAEYYVKLGFSIAISSMNNDYGQDFIAESGSERIGVVIKFATKHTLPILARLILRKQISSITGTLERDNLTKCHVVIVIRGEIDANLEEKLIRYLSFMPNNLDYRIEFKFGCLGEDNSISTLKDIPLIHNV